MDATFTVLSKAIYNLPELPDAIWAVFSGVFQNKLINIFLPNYMQMDLLKFLAVGCSTYCSLGSSKRLGFDKKEKAPDTSVNF